MPIEQTRQGAVTVIRPTGALAGEPVEEFRSVVERAAGEAMGRLVIDASAIPLADSAGLEALADAADRLAQSGQSLRLCAAQETLREALEITDLSGLFEHYADVQTAVRSFL
jgi:anti-anti-sigma factor